jgi:hypothetical protein
LTAKLNGPDHSDMTTPSSPSANTYQVDIKKGPLKPGSNAPGYFPSVMPIPKSPGVMVDSAFGSPTQDGAIDQLARKLHQNVHPQNGDKVRYNGKDYSTVKDAIDAITADKPNWV